ncbi:MAG: AAA family ATPase, partial [Candidatus Micrarchaeaceae archaeon]
MPEPFSELLKESKIFVNREALSPHFIPETLLFRDKQIDSIIKALLPALKGSRGRNIFIYGKTGTGKTSCIKNIISKINSSPSVKAKISYINCRIYNSRYRVLNKIVADNMPTYAKRGYGIVDIYEKIISWIEEDGKILIVVLDEIDTVKDLDDLIYTLSRANSDIKSGGITMIGISNRISFKDQLDPRSLSTLDETEIVFPPYNSNELAAIMQQRLAIATKPNVVENAAVNLAAAIAAGESGDARLALKILAKACELSEEEGLAKVTTREVERAAKTAEEEVAYDLVSTLPEHQNLVLYAIALLTLKGGRYKKLADGEESFLFSGEVYEKYVEIAESLRKEAKSSRWYRKYISDLDMQGLISTSESGRGVRGHTKLIKLLYPPERIKETIEKRMMLESTAEGT